LGSLGIGLKGPAGGEFGIEYARDENTTVILQILSNALKVVDGPDTFSS